MNQNQTVSEWKNVAYEWWIPFKAMSKVLGDKTKVKKLEEHFKLLHRSDETSTIQRLIEVNREMKTLAWFLPSNCIFVHQCML